MKAVAHAIQIGKLTVAYGDTVVLDSLDLALAAGNTRVILGANGSGKSTLFHTISGTVQPKMGTIRIGNVDVTHMTPHRRARRFIGRSFQIPKLSADLTVDEHMALAGERLAAGALGITAFGTQSVGELTHAERKILEIATTFALRAPILLLDEPSAGLDSVSKDRLADHLLAMSGSATTLIIEHDIEFIERLAVPVLLLAGGRIVLEDSISEVRKYAQARGMYF